MISRLKLWWQRLLCPHWPVRVTEETSDTTEYWRRFSSPPTIFAVRPGKAPKDEDYTVITRYVQRTQIRTTCLACGLTRVEEPHDPL